MSTSTVSPLKLHAVVETFPLKEPFRITGRTFLSTDVATVALTTGGCTGRGEGAGVYYRSDDVPHMIAQIEAARAAIEAGLDRQTLQRLLPPGGARNAVDCALWDLEAKLTGRSVWEMAGVDSPRPLQTTFTIGANDPDKMAADADSYTQARALKLKLTGQDIDAERVSRVRAARPDVWLAVDANQGFTLATLERFMPLLQSLGVQLIEQPFAVGQDAQLDGLDSPIPVAADESVQCFADLQSLVGRFSVVNIKLDKCGGLTEGLAMAREARRLGLGVMVGNMVGTSLAMAPAFVVGQLCSIVDLDGPALLLRDRSPPVRYRDGTIECPPELWGAPEVA